MATVRIATAPRYRGGRGLREGDLRALSSAARARSTTTRWPSGSASRRRRRRRWSSGSTSSGLVDHEPYRGVELTAAGERVALEVLRHHRLLELYLAEALGVPWDRVHDEAEVLEHDISEELEELIAAKLGNPTHDPHGDPIPTRDVEIDETPTRAADRPRAGRARAFVRVSDSDPEMLRYLAERGIAPGDGFEVVEQQPFDGPLIVRFGDQRARARRRARPRDARRVTRVSRRLRRPGRGTSPAPSGAARRLPAERARRAARPRAPALRPRAARPGLRRRGRLRRPGQLRHQHRRRRQVRLPAAVGDPRREPDGDADPVPVGQGRHRHRPQPARAVPRALPAPGLDRASGSRPS